MLPPLLLRPHYVAKPWGGRRLETVLGRTGLPDGPVGESWEVGTLDAWESVIDGGAHDGGRLSEFWGGPFPLLVKVIDAREDLSVQVHPDGLDGVPAKEEAWVALADGGGVAVGEVGGDVLPAAGAWLERLQSRTLAAAGRAPPSLVHVPPGTVHAILAGALVWEVQTPVDVTWRLDDHGRTGLDGHPRALHLAQARAVLARRHEPVGEITGDGRCLEGRRLRVETRPPGTWEDVRAHLVAFLPAGGRVIWGQEEVFAVPPGRTVVLPSGPRRLLSDGWMLAAGPAQVDGRA